MQKVYRILVNYDLYEYQVTQCNRETDERGLFVNYINTFLKLMVFRSGFDALRTRMFMKNCFGRAIA